MPLVFSRIDKEAWIGDYCVNIQVDNQLSRQPGDSKTNTNDFTGSKNNIVEKIGLTKDSEWAIRRGCFTSYGLFYSGTITMLAPNDREMAFLSDIANAQTAKKSTKAYRASFYRVYNNSTNAVEIAWLAQYAYYDHAACPFKEGIFLVNISPAHMNFRPFLVDNFIVIFSSLVTPAQVTAVMDLIEEHWEEWFGEMPLKITHPTLKVHEWRIVTGFDKKIQAGVTLLVNLGRVSV
uniref:Alkaline/neutral invertase n=1 Tax=Nicotiana sylvestris TaxID=4096 RepID=A0A1U7YL09_NICSY|nr:PREDICTED: uncharacterized protein LOC104249133 [Nicotiana sylvestris]